MYWLFKRYMKKLIDEYQIAWEEHQENTKDPSMKADLYWLQKYLNGDFRKK